MSAAHITKSTLFLRFPNAVWSQFESKSAKNLTVTKFAFVDNEGFS